MMRGHVQRALKSTALRIPYRAKFLRLSGFQSERLGAVELKSSRFLRAILDLSLERFNPLHHPASCLQKPSALRIVNS
jgi:hypothetical protein